jgi:hypothetical protein
MAQTIEEIIRLEMRLSAIEFLLCRLTAATLIASGKTERDLESWRAEMRKTLQKQTFGGLDAATSDAAAAELEGAVDYLLGRLRTQMASLKGEDRK